MNTPHSRDRLMMLVAGATDTYSHLLPRFLLPLYWHTDTRQRMLAAMIAASVLISAEGCGYSHQGAMSGTWAFTFATTTPDYFVATANLTQNGDQLTGQATMSGDEVLCGTTATLSGTVSGNQLSLQLVQAQSVLSLTGTANQEFTSVSGTYSSGNDTCFSNISFGSWTANFQ